MNYRALLADKATLKGKKCKCLSDIRGGEITLTAKDRYPVLFVLAGSLTLFGDDNAHLFSAGEMVIADRERITRCCCPPETLVLEYQLPKALTSRFGAFDASVTPAIPITGRLETWVEQCLLHRQESHVPQDEELIGILVRYQSRRLKTLCETMRFYLHKLHWSRYSKQHIANLENSIS